MFILLALSATVAMAAPLSAPAAKPEGVPANAPYTLALPAGWWLVSSRPPEAGEGELNDRYEDGRGNWFHVMEWGAPDGSPADVFWWLEWNATGRGYRIKTEGKPCKKERCDQPPGYQCDLCEIGDGKFHGYAKADEDGPNVSLHFGNTQRESGVDLAPFRALIAAFRMKPQK
jgi:hypothetical protein